MSSNNRNNDDTTHTDASILSQLRQYQIQSRLDDELNERCRHQIDSIFEYTDLLIEGHDKEFDKQLVYDGMDESLPIPSTATLTAFAIQLNKLRILHLKLKTDAMNVSKERIKGKIEVLKEKKQEQEKKLDQLRLDLLKSETKLISNGNARIDSLNSQIEENKSTKNKQVGRQVLRLQEQNFKILKEISFQNKERKLLFNHQPILKLEELLGYNLLVINQFLERLIVLQIQLSDLFRVELPHLPELVGFLPDSKFYDLIRKKQQIIKGSEEDGLSDVESSTDTPTSEDSLIFEVPKDIQNPTEKIIKLGDAYKLPLSSKTLNHQRRAHRSNSVEPADLSNIPIIKHDRSVSPSTSSPKKNMVIIPHKIINKPFNRLSIKDFLRFFLVIVKLITNFQVFLMFTGEIEDMSLDEWCNFEKVLRQVMNLDLGFKKRLYEQEKQAVDYATSAVRTNFQDLMEHVYELLMKSSAVLGTKKKHSDKPMAFLDLKLRDIIRNPTRLNLSEEWDIVSHMI
ncbi:uncharacterized protein SPAPADRAFT_148495 [Spathaspora passalidarum NRRL Y-27907]|uniref:Uncharacterized protein n=1 Tax=Spathaspora passalidarum (strain NRRL Y-27907 / 11-Y1) TaxID=619300 RepID=G3AHC9_SPAPN|nr:uncharacterized protein SPAPADRAFT_148495 [Spathaspora passalidarum NRRL Y-27907]EGW34093.1 hypothetical protein SPAPADRAFT_148495 [Spathaspora passalidarum NRRL Y-27907]